MGDINGGYQWGISMGDIWSISFAHTPLVLPKLADNLSNVNTLHVDKDFYICQNSRKNC